MTDTPFTLTQATFDVLAVLAAAEHGSYGFQIAQITGRKSGVVTPILHRLEGHGWVTSEWNLSPEGRGPRRRVFKTNPEFVEKIHAIVQARERIEAERGAHLTKAQQRLLAEIRESPTGGLCILNHTTCSQTAAVLVRHGLITKQRERGNWYWYEPVHAQQSTQVKK